MNGKLDFAGTEEESDPTRTDEQYYEVEDTDPPR